MSTYQRDDIVGKVHAQIMQIESRLLLCSLHTVGVSPSAEEAIATLVNITQPDRPEDKIECLPRVIAASVGRDILDIYRTRSHAKFVPQTISSMKTADNGNTSTGQRFCEGYSFVAQY